MLHIYTVFLTRLDCYTADTSVVPTDRRIVLLCERNESRGASPLAAEAASVIAQRKDQGAIVQIRETGILL